jgi:hypothetical protein
MAARLHKVKIGSKENLSYYTQWRSLGEEEV